jgi:hypothetical protein
MSSIGVIVRASQEDVPPMSVTASGLYDEAAVATLKKLCFSSRHPVLRQRGRSIHNLSDRRSRARADMD